MGLRLVSIFRHYHSNSGGTGLLLRFVSSKIMCLRTIKTATFQIGLHVSKLADSCEVLCAITVLHGLILIVIQHEIAGLCLALCSAFNLHMLQDKCPGPSSSTNN